MPDYEFTKFTQHVLIYAKSWYAETNAVDDIKTIMGKLSNHDPKNIPTMDVLEFVSNILHKFTLNSSDARTLSKEMWQDWKTPGAMGRMKVSLTPEDVIQAQLQVLRHKSYDEHPAFDVEPDPNILPLATDASLERWRELREVKTRA